MILFKYSPRLPGTCNRARAAIGIAACSLLVLLVFTARSSNTVLKSLPRMFLSSPGNYNLGFLWYNVAGSTYFHDHLYWTMRSLLKRSSVQLDIHVVTGSSQDFAMARDIIWKVADELGVDAPQVWMVTGTQFIESHRDQVNNIKTLNARPGLMSHQDINALYPFLPYLLEGISEIIMMDSDLRFLDDVKNLFDEFSRFPPSALIGCAPELNPSFYIDLAKYRQHNPDTPLGKTEPKHMQGLNTGVLMLKLGGLKNSPTYKYRLNKTGSSAMFEKYMFDADRPWQAGHQDYFTLLSYEHPELFHFLGCGWNRNMCKAIFPKDMLKGVPDVDRYFTCFDRAKVLHGNCQAVIPEEV